MICAGFSDGTVRVYDQRSHRSRALVRTWNEHHNSPIINLHMQRGGLRELVSCSQDGVVKFWDAQHGASLQTVQTTKDAAMAMSVHEHAPVFAV
jgi:regulator-associated protein of mTOR